MELSSSIIAALTVLLVRLFSVIILIELCNGIRLLVSKHDIVCLISRVEQDQVFTFLVLDPLTLDNDGSGTDFPICCSITRLDTNLFEAGSFLFVDFTLCFGFRIISLLLCVRLGACSLAFTIRQCSIGLLLGIICRSS